MGKIDKNASVWNLSHAHLDDEAVERVATLLVDSPNLKEVDLGWNSFGDEGCKCIAAALASNTTISELKLHRNHIGKEGANALAQALKRNNTLLSLDLYWNEIGTEGANMLKEALRYNTHLQRLDLQCNDIDEATDQEIRNIMKRRERKLKSSSSRRLRRSSLKEKLQEKTEQTGTGTPSSPSSSQGDINKTELLSRLTCPISHEVMQDPVLAEDGHTYERREIENWLQRSNRSPITNCILGPCLVPNRIVKDMLEYLSGE